MTALLTPPPVKKVVGPQGDAIDAPPVLRTTTITLIGAQLLPTPVTMGAALNAIVVLPGFSINPQKPNALGAQLTLVQLLVMLAALKASFAQCAVALFKNNIVPSQVTAWGDLVEPVGSWYAQVDTTLGAAQQFPSGDIGYTGESAQFTYTGSSSPEQIFGWGLINVVTS